MSNDSNAIDRVKAGTDAHTDRAFGYVTEWSSVGGKARIRMSDNSAWTLAGEDNINKYRDLLDLSKALKKPILLAVDKKTQDIGLIFSTMTGMPEFNGETADGKRLQVNIPPSMRVFRLQKDRRWFDKVKRAISDAQSPANRAHPPKLWIAFDSETSEIVDVRAASD